MLNLEEDIKIQQLFCEQVNLCTVLMRLYHINPELFKSTFSPRFEKVYGFKPYETPENFWEYCDWLSSILTGHWSDGKYPVIIKKGKKVLVDYVTSKNKGHDPFKKVVPAVESVYCDEYCKQNPIKKK